MKNQGGFTLIELITVVVILGVLAAFAIPRFSGLETEARTATVNGIGGSVRAGAALAHAQWMVGNSPATITMEGQSVDMDTTTGYPTAASGGIDKTLQNTQGFTLVPPSGGGTTFAFTLDDSPDSANCKVTYALGGSAGVAPTINSVTTGC